MYFLIYSGNKTGHLEKKIETNVKLLGFYLNKLMMVQDVPKYIFKYNNIQCSFPK